MLETPPEMSQIDGSPVAGNEATPEPLREPLSNLAVEITRVSAELQSINAGFQGQVLQAIAEVQRSMEIEFKERLEREIQATREQLIGRLAQTEAEIRRVTTLLETVSAEITAMIDDPNAELSKVMRKKSEESVLRSYLDGLKFAAGEPTS
jgi:septal ring factor EnvC (AmiA/AmiB activator)